MVRSEPDAGKKGRGGATREARRQRYLSGFAAERLAALFLMLKGYRILGIRVRTAAGEIDLIVLRGDRLAFVEVKRRTNVREADVEGSVSLKQRRRVRSAAQLWLARHPQLQDRELHFDLVVLFGYSLPKHLADGL